MNKKGLLATFVVIFIIVIDQAIKVWVKTHMYLHESIEITPWFYISFIENNGMAYGMQLGSKYVLTGFRIIASIALGIYIAYCVAKNKSWGYIALMSGVLAGALGNLVDCMFYGLCFTASTPFHMAMSVPFGHGYESFMLGRVVDMFYFPLFEYDVPSFIPFIGGQHNVFFSPVFNFADASISVAVVLLLIGFWKELSEVNFDDVKTWLKR